MFQGKNCVIVGAMEGMGHQIAEQLASKGCSIAFMDMRKEAGKKLAAALKKRFGVDTFFFHGDMHKEEDLELFAHAAGARYGRIHFFICMAGLQKNGLLSGYDTLQDMQTIFRNSVSVPYVLHKALQEYMETGGMEVYAVPGREMFRREDRAAYEIVNEAVEVLQRTCREAYRGRVRVRSICTEGLKMMAYPEVNGWNITCF